MNDVRSFVTDNKHDYKTTLLDWSGLYALVAQWNNLADCIIDWKETEFLSYTLFQNISTTKADQLNGCEPGFEESLLLK